MDGGYYVHSYRRRLVVFSGHHGFIHSQDCRMAYRYTNDERVSHQIVTTSVKQRETNRESPSSLGSWEPYASNDYQQLLQEHHFQVSMSRRGNCYDNACIE